MKRIHSLSGSKVLLFTLFLFSIPIALSSAAENDPTIQSKRSLAQVIKEKRASLGVAKTVQAEFGAQITDTNVEKWSIDWSPDGSLIAFEQGNDIVKTQIYG